MKTNKLEGYELAGRFRLDKLLGKGGYGAVFKAEQLSMGRTCAVKVLVPNLTSDDATVQRFKREARSTSKLAHPHTIVIYDFGLDEEVNLLFLAMEYLQGSTLNELIVERGTLEVETAVHIVEQAASSLDDAAEAGIVHRDIKPHNLMITRRGNHDHYVKVIDFGIAKALKGEDPNRITAMDLTQTGTIVGTPQYMSPEQIRDESLDGRSDQYSLAVCLYKMLVGQTPFTGGSAIDIASRHLRDRPLPLTALDQALPISEEFENVLFKALAKNRDDRYASSSEFASALRTAWENMENCGLEVTTSRAESAPSEAVMEQPLSTPPSGSIGVAAPSGTFVPNEGESTAPTQMLTGETEQPAQEAWAPESNETVRVPAGAASPADATLPAAPEWTGALSPEVAEYTSSGQSDAGHGVRVAGGMPSSDLPDQPGHTVMLDAATDASGPTGGGEETAAVAMPSASDDETSDALPLWMIAAAILAGLVLIAVVATQMSDVDEEKEGVASEATEASSQEARAEASEAKTDEDESTGFVFSTDAGVAEKSPQEKSKKPDEDPGTTTAVKDQADPGESEPAKTESSASETQEKAEAKESEEEPEKGFVKVTIMPWGELYVGRRKYGTSVRQTIALEPGRHRLRLKQNGETKASKTVTVTSGRSTRVLLRAK